MDDFTDPKRFSRLIQELSDGSPSASEQVLRACGPVVFRIIRRRLKRRSPRFDSMDIAQAVWASFFTSTGRLARFNSINEMIRFLATMATNKVNRMQRDHFVLQKRNAKRETSLDTISEPNDIERLGIGPTPSQLAVADETWERLLAETSRSQQQILYLQLDGKTQDEIAQALGVTNRTVSRIMNRLRKRILPS